MIWRILLIVIILCHPAISFAAKKECTELLTKFHNIQAKQRQAQSLKNSNRLNEKEDIARERWWDCENNKQLSKNKKSFIKKTNKPKKKTSQLYRKDKQSAQHFSSNKLVLKGRYSGDKQFKWLAFYKRPKKCVRPKTTQAFAYCMDHKEKQQLEFEKQYNKTSK